MSRDFLVYLAGPITGCSYGECRNWRKQAIADLYRTHNYLIGVDPMRGTDHLHREQELKSVYDSHILTTGKAVTLRDKFEVKRCDLVLANFLGAQKVSTGTAIELGWASAWDKPIIVVMEAENPHRHCMVENVAWFIVETLEAGIRVAADILIP